MVYYMHGWFDFFELAIISPGWSLNPFHAGLKTLLG